MKGNEILSWIKIIVIRLCDDSDDVNMGDNVVVMIVIVTMIRHVSRYINYIKITITRKTKKKKGGNEIKQRLPVTLTTMIS